MLSYGVTSMRTDEVANLPDIPPEQVRTRLTAPRKAGVIVSPARGLWVPAPSERAGRRAPEPEETTALWMTLSPLPSIPPLQSGDSGGS